MSRLASIASLLLALAGAATLFACAGTATALAGAPHWYILTRSAPTRLADAERGMMVTQVINLGDAPVQATEADPVEITDILPAGTVLAPGKSVFAEADYGTDGEPRDKVLHCEHLTCEFVGTLPPYISIEVQVPIEQQGESSAQNRIEVEGAGVPAASAEGQRPSSDGGGFAVESFALTPETEAGDPDENAGSHPFQLTTAVAFNEGFGALKGETGVNELPEAPQLLKNLRTTLPPGLVADTNAVPTCSAFDFGAISSGNFNNCPLDTAIGVAEVTFRDPTGLGKHGTETVPVFNVETSPGEPARLGFSFEKVAVTLDTALKTGEGYAVEVSSINTSATVEVLSAIVSVWGVPTAASHDSARGWECIGAGEFKLRQDPRPCKPAEEAHPAPYLTLPTQCKQLHSSVQAESWNAAEPAPDVVESPFPALKGCAGLPFTPSIELTPFTSAASTPTGLKTVVKLPQSSTLESTESEAGKAEQDVQSTTVTLPEGVLSNPGLANGLTACPVGAVGFEEDGPTLQASLEEQRFYLEPEDPTEACKTAKLGDVTIVSPLIPHPLTGSVYLGAQDTNPFRSPLVLYLIAGEKEEGIHVKLAGEVQINDQTGQLTSVFSGTPPVPFETLELTLANEENGERAANTTPPRCGPATTTAAFTPYSEEAGRPAVAVPATHTFEVTSGPDGLPCPGATLPFGPSFAAGSTNKQAGAFTPFTVTIGHADGDQPLEKIDMQLPPGLSAAIASVTECSEEQALADSCPASSLVGESTSVSGLGGKPVTLKGSLYLTGALQATSTHGASPFGLLDVTPVEVGPFHLEPVKVLSTINIDETTAAASVSSEKIPQMVQGVPAQLKEVNVTVNRANFQFNPTNCEQLSLTGSLSGYEGAVAGISEPFYVTNCGALPFEPKLTATVAGQGSKANGTTFAVTIESPGLGQANIHKVDLTIPALLPSRLTTIQQACLEATFNANPASCDEGSVIGEGIVHTPVLANPLRGPAYLVSHGNAAFPDVEFVLQGEGVKIVVDGKTDIKNGVTYSRFETSPDAPFTTFESIFPAGPHSALTPNVPEQENYNLCKHKLTIPTEITGQNGAFISQTTKVAVTGCGGVKSSKVRKLTLRQKLSKQLRQCRKHYKHNKRKRHACEKRARARYAAAKLASTLKSCKKKHRHSAKSRAACERKARKSYARAVHVAKPDK
jgi:hypothetical protein